jgi:hypothetical protein
MPFGLVPVGGESEHGGDELLELQRRPDLAHEMQLLVARVPELMRGARRNGQAFARAGHALFAAEPETCRAVKHLEALFLRRMDVRCGDGAARVD